MENPKNGSRNVLIPPFYCEWGQLRYEICR
jgi:hypothetical protein